MFELDALIEQANDSDLQMILVSDIMPDPEQPRKDIDVADLKTQLEAADWKLINPITVRLDPVDSSKYIIVTGERRWTCFKQGDQEFIQAFVREYESEQEIAVEMVVENVQRESLTLVEEARALRELKEKHAMPSKDIASKIGKSPSYVSERINYHADIPVFQSIADLYDSARGVTDSILLRDLLKIAKTNPKAVDIVIAVGQANNCLDRKFVREALKFNLAGDVEQQALQYIAGGSVQVDNTNNISSIGEESHSQEVQGEQSVSEQQTQSFDNEHELSDNSFEEGRGAEDGSPEEGEDVSDVTTVVGDVECAEIKAKDLEITVSYKGSPYFLDVKMKPVEETEIDRVIIRPLGNPDKALVVAINDVKLTSLT